jgi:hypothetical protein
VLITKARSKSGTFCYHCSQVRQSHWFLSISVVVIQILSTTTPLLQESRRYVISCFSWLSTCSHYTKHLQVQAKVATNTTSIQLDRPIACLRSSSRSFGPNSQPGIYGASRASSCATRNVHDRWPENFPISCPAGRNSIERHLVAVQRCQDILLPAKRRNIIKNVPCQLAHLRATKFYCKSRSRQAEHADPCKPTCGFPEAEGKKKDEKNPISSRKASSEDRKSVLRQFVCTQG